MKKEDKYIKKITREIDILIKKDKSANQISEITNISNYYIKKYASDKKRLINNNLNRQIRVRMTRGGDAAKYKKLRTEINEGKHKCEECGTIKNVEIHHKEKLKYNKNYETWKVLNFNNNINNISFLCNSHHQKLHYKKLGKKHKVNHDPITGRFMKGVFKGDGQN